jgi:hypothetical protein
MQEFIQHFVRDGGGVWTCISPATLNHPKGRIQVSPGAKFPPGTIFMGVEIAAWLDAEMLKHERRA